MDVLFLLKGCETSRDWKTHGSGTSCGSQLGVDSTHTEAQRSVGLSLPGDKDKRPLAGMHVPTAAVVRAAQRSGIGIKGARQRVLNTGTT